MMFSTRNVYRFAALVRKSDAERTMEKLISLGMFHPKKVERTFDGPFSSRSARRYLPYQKKISDIITMIEASGVSCDGKLKTRDQDAFLESVSRDLPALEQKAIANKATSDDLLRLHAAAELLEFKKSVSELAKTSEMADGFVIVEGWIDKESLPRLKKEVDGPNALFEYVEGDDGPTLLKNRLRLEPAPAGLRRRVPGSDDDPPRPVQRVGNDHRDPAPCLGILGTGLGGRTAMDPAAVRRCAPAGRSGVRPL